MRVLYFTIIGQADGPQNGGSLCSQTHVRNLRRDSGIELAVVIAAPEDARAPVVSFMNDQGIKQFLFVPLQSRVRRVRDYLKYRWTRIVGFPFEAAAAKNPHVKQHVLDALKRWNVDVLVVDYLYSALFCPDLVDREVPTAIITLNREAEFFRECAEQGVVRRNPIRIAIASARLQRFEQETYSRSARVIALGRPDVPSYLPPSQVDCITPHLDESAERWRFSGSDTAYFVGNISHYPNRLAIEFIARCLAPRIAARRADVVIKIIGADITDVPADWRHPIISYLGVSDTSTVRSLFQTSDLFLCPIKNTFGMKFKLAEAASYAAPFLASRESALCLPYLSGLPLIDLADYESAADIVCRLVGNRTELQRISASIRSGHQSFVASQKNIWSRSLAHISAFSNSAVQSQDMSRSTSVVG